MLSRLRARDGRNGKLLKTDLGSSKAPKKKLAETRDDVDSDYEEPAMVSDYHATSEQDSDFESDSASKKRTKRSSQKTRRNTDEVKKSGRTDSPDQGEVVSKTVPKRKRPASRKSKKLDHDNITLEHLRKAFLLLDRDSKGIITRIDLQQAMAEIGGDPLPDQEAIEMLSEADLRGDQNGSVNISDFLIMMTSVFPSVF